MPFSFSTKEILETVSMLQTEKLDIRTITMGINIQDCRDTDGVSTGKKVYDKIKGYARNLVQVGDEIEKTYGIPIINKRIAVSPVSIVGNGLSPAEMVTIGRYLDQAAQDVGVNFIGGFTALVHKGFSNGDRALLEAIPETLAVTERVCASVNIGTTKAGINMDAVYQMGHIIKATAELTGDENGLGCAKLVVFCNAAEDNPFMAGAYMGAGEPEVTVDIGVSGPGVVNRALGDLLGASLDQVAEEIKKAAFKITRAGQLVGDMASERLGVPFGIVDLSLAPTAEQGDSVAHILEHMGLDQVGTHGTTAALALLNDAVKKGGMMACSRVGGLSGSFIPVSEDKGMIDAVRAGTITMDKLEAMTSICSVGFDMIAIPGETSAETIAGMIADEAAIGVMNHKTTAVRVIPVPGTQPGDEVNFGGLLGYAPIIPVNQVGNGEFIRRGGFIPAPVHGFRN